ncbi:MAG: glycosyltransferase [Bacteroidia bacterium]|nr:MAG: glycosyltransferase [Bacteroidia bacterium]
MISIVLPAYSEEDNIRPLCREIIAYLEESSGFEIIFVDDGSRDLTYERIEELARIDARVKGIRLSRNFGHQTALLAGLNEAAGEVVIMMDADGQHPPSMIPRLIEKLDEGFDVVNTTRIDARGTGLFKRISSRWFYRVFNTLSDTRIEPASADFRIMNRKALDAFLTIEEHDRFTRGLVSWMGFRQTHLPYQAEKRISGRSKYSLKRMRLFAFDGVTSFSSKPLRISMILGLATILGGFVYMIYAVVMYLQGHTNPGWTSLLITVLLIGGIQLFSIGILGEYLGRIFHEAKRRPHYFIEKRTSKPGSQGSKR